jgi:hypothetical protein
MAPSPAIEANIREKAAKFDELYDRVMSCHVIVEAPHRHHHKGKAYQVCIYLTVPGGELVINRAPKHLDAAKTPAGRTGKGIGGEPRTKQACGTRRCLRRHS